MINYQFYPNYTKIPNHLFDLVSVFKTHSKIDTTSNHELSSNSILEILRNDLLTLGYEVESGKKTNQKIKKPVLYGKNQEIIKSFDVDAYHDIFKTVIEVEAGRAVANNQFLKDIFQACVMIDVEYLVIAVRNIYRNNKNFDTIVNFLETLYSSKKFSLPLKGILLIGY